MTMCGEAEWQEEAFTVTAGPEAAGIRLDVFCHSIPASGITSRNYAQKLIEAGHITVNGKCYRTNYKVKAGDEIRFVLPPPAPLDVLPENLPLDIVYEDRDLLVINKARGMVVHPAPGNYSGTLVNALLYHCRDLSDVNGVIRPGIVHRIDKDTTGLLVVAKNNAAHLSLAEQLKNHGIRREYIAIAEGVLREDSGTIDLAIGRCPSDRKKMAVRREAGREAVTHFSVLERLKGHTLVACRLETGRTHQIRVHLAYIGHPLVGDPLYGTKETHGMSGQALHARTLSFIHPASGVPVSFSAEPPQDFSRLASGLSDSVSFTI